MITRSLSRWHSRSSAWLGSIRNASILQQPQPEDAARRMELDITNINANVGRDNVYIFTYYVYILYIYIYYIQVSQKWGKTGQKSVRRCP